MTSPAFRTLATAGLVLGLSPFARAEMVAMPIERVIVAMSAGRVVAHLSGYLPSSCYGADGVQQVRQGRVIDIRVAMERPSDPTVACLMMVRPFRTSVPLEGDFPRGEYLLRVNDVERAFRVPLEVQGDPLPAPLPPSRATAPGWVAYMRQDHGRALRELTRLAEEGQPEAQLAVGNFHYHGRSVSRDSGAAARWYRRAAEQGLPAAQFNLGLVTARGEGVARDPVEAYFWIRLAVSRLRGTELDEASRARETLVAELTPEQTARAEERVRTWTPSPEVRR